MFVKSLSFSVVKLQFFLIFRLLLRVLFFVKNNNNNCNNVCKKIKFECGDYIFLKLQFFLSALIIRLLNVVVFFLLRGRFSCRLQVDDEGFFFLLFWLQKVIVMGFLNLRGGIWLVFVMNISICFNW